MNTERHLLFPPFRLDPVNQRLWREGQEIPLRQKTFAVLRYLLEHPDQLVTKAALLDALWPGVYVSDVVPGVCIQELRRALGDKRKTPRFIVTVHGRGYRFIAPVAAAAAPVPSSPLQVPRADTQDSAFRTRHSILVGREAELAQLHGWLDKALSGERQMVFITGEPGIGKSALANAGLEQGGVIEECWVGRGQCIEQFGAGEPYLPLLEAVGALCQEPGGSQLVTVLQQYAPTWLLQLPALLGLWGFYLERAEIQRARELAEQSLSLAQNVHDPISLVWAHGVLGDLLYRLGEFAPARAHLEQGIALSDPQQHRPSAALDAPRVHCLSFAALTLWFLGYPDQALQTSHKALTLAQGTSHPFSLAFALELAAALHSARREGRAVQERAEAPLHLLTSKDSSSSRRWGLSCRAGRWPSRDRSKRGLPRYARARPPGRLCGQS